MRILCEAFRLQFEGRDRRSKRLLVQKAPRRHRAGKMLVPIINDTHFKPSVYLHKLRLLCEEIRHSDRVRH